MNVSPYTTYILIGVMSAVYVILWLMVRYCYVGERPAALLYLLVTLGMLGYAIALHDWFAVAALAVAAAGFTWAALPAKKANA